MHCNIINNFIPTFFESVSVDMHNEEIIIALNKNRFEILLKCCLNSMKSMWLMILIFIRFHYCTSLMNSLMNLSFNEPLITIFGLLYK